MMKKQIPLLHTHSALTSTSHFRPHFFPNSPTHFPAFFSQVTSLSLFPLLHLILLSLVSNMSTDPLNKYHIPNLKLVDSCLRLSVIPLSIASIWLTVTDYEDNSSYGALGFSDLTGVKYMVCISFISAIYALGAAISSWITCLVSRAWFFFVSDQLVAYLMVTSTAAVVEILYLAYNGDKEVTWSEACSSYGKFCSRLKLALVFHGLVLCFFFVLAVMSAFRAFSVYEAPYTDEPKRVVEV